MHVVFRESHGLEETETPTDLGQSPADLLALSFSDSDLGAFAAGWRRGGGPEGRLPTLRLANLSALRHPVSVDQWIEATVEGPSGNGAKGVLIRLIGGAPFWPYGLERLSALARRQGVALAVLPADGREDPALDEASTLPVSTLRRLQHLCDEGGAVAGQAALAQLALAAGLYAGPVRGAKSTPPQGFWSDRLGPLRDRDAALAAARDGLPADAPVAALVFYRAWLTAADLAPIEALAAAMRARGFAPLGLFAPSLKAPEAAEFLKGEMAAIRPAVVLNATAFSGKGAEGTSPLDAAGVPVLQTGVATNDRAKWAEAERGLSPADLAMHVALPEVDGRIFAGAVSFKQEDPRDEALQFSRMVHAPEPSRIAAAADRAVAWARLGRIAPGDLRAALILSTYPGRDWNMAHAVGLDAVASAGAILSDLRAAGHDAPDPGEGLEAQLAQARLFWPMAAYRDALSRLPQALQDDLSASWGAPEADPDAGVEGFHFRAVRAGRMLLALQPERGRPEAKDAEYHDLSRCPRHGYVAFHLWLQTQVDALVHIGAHGTLEWLPGKAVALSEACWPEALTGSLPVLYPFIVNDPGEAAQAKRRIGAVTLGHMPPPQRVAGAGKLARLEALLDEFSNADGLDPRRRDRLQADIRIEAQAQGVEDDLGLTGAMDAAEALTRIDRFVCDVKESQYGDGLHVWGRAPAQDAQEATCAASEAAALLDALRGRRVPAGPAGSPHRGRSDVLPTGRNLFAVDPRGVPTRSAYEQGAKNGAELIRRHLQQEGDYPHGLVVDLWGSASMRTAGEEFAMALSLIGAKPVWDDASGRVTGVEITPITELSHPRIDVTLRVSGLFRDVFPGLTALFAQAVRALAARDEAPDWNPFVIEGGARVFGPKPGEYGLGMGPMLTEYTEDARHAAGEAWLAASAFALDGDAATLDEAGIRARVRGADAFAHPQDLAETDLLLAEDYAAHEGGFAAARQALGAGPAALWHLDATDPDRPRARALAEEVARVVRARASHPGWIAGMKRHGFRGAAEIAATVEHLGAFAHLADAAPSHLFDIMHDATLGDADTRGFMEEANPAALAALQARFAALRAAGLWTSRRNAVAAEELLDDRSEGAA